MKLRALNVFSLSVLLAATAAGQTTSTEVLGTVADASGAVIAGANVTLTRIQTGEHRNTTTTRTGDYSFPLIEIGDYRVSVSIPGFKSQEQTGIHVELQQKARVNFSLTVGDTKESVEVVATGVELKTDDAAVGQVVDNRRITELPINGRNIAALAVLTPGVAYGSRQGLSYSGESGGFVGGKIIALAANGQRELNQQVTLDGVIATGSQVNVANLVPSVDSVQEMKVQTSSYSAEYGQNNGAIVQIAMKTGTNNLHGTLFEFLRNNKFAAKDYFLNFQLPAGSPQLDKPVLRRNQFGVFLSGPVEIPKIYHGRNKTFWTFTYEGYRQTQENPSLAFWFPQEMRNGDFSKLLTPFIRNGKPVRAPIYIYDPSTGDVFPNNIVPASRINKNAQAFVNKYLPLPTLRPDDYLDSNVQGLVKNIGITNQYGFRIDHNITANDRVFVRYLTDRQLLTSGNINPNFPGYQYSWPTNIATQYLHIFNPRIVNEFRYGWNSIDDRNGNPRTGTSFDPDSLGLGAWKVGGTRALTPAETGVPSINGILGGDSGNSFDVNRTHQFTDNLSIIHGSHSFKMGGEWRHPKLDVGASNNPRGFLSCCPGGYNLAGWLLGYISGSQTPEGYSFSAPRQNRISGYFQDEWKLTRKLTVNMGLRWDYFGVPLEQTGKWRTLSLSVLTPASDGKSYPTMIPNPNTPGYQFVQREYRYLMPRIGFAYRVAPKWVLRAGGGWFANGQQLDNFQILSRNPPAAGTFSWNAVTDPAQQFSVGYGGQTYQVSTSKIRPGSTVLTLDNPFPGQGAPNKQSANVIMIPYDNKQSSNVQWNFDVQRELPWQSFLTVAYVGSKTSHIDTSVHSFNDPTPAYLDTNFQARRPYQYYVSQGEDNTPRPLGQIRLLDDNSNGSYHGLQTSLEKRYSAGLTFTLNYVYGKALGEGYERNGGSPYQDPRNRRADRARYPFDITHSASVSYVYEPSFLKNFKGITKALIGGWQTSGIVTLRTGLPFNLTNPGGGGSLNVPDGTARPDRIGDGSLGSAANRQLWYDPTAFRRTDCNIPGRPDLCHYGSAANYILDMPGVRRIDMTVQKNWEIPKMGEQAKLQFRAEFYNALNTPAFGAPNGLGYVSNSSVTPDAPRVGEIRGLSLPMRLIQFGMKLYF